MLMKFPFQFLAIACATGFLAVSLSAANNKIAIKAEATVEYTKARALDEDKKIQTYQFMKGRYFPGDVKRVTMEKFTFMELLENMAAHLRKQNFYPDPENGEGDLVLVVHYGVTDYEMDIQESMGYTSLADMEFQDIDDLEFGLSAKEWMDNSRASSRSMKARLLGMEEAYDWKRKFDDHHLQIMVEEPRYFVVVMAYDLPLAKQGILEVHWTTRYSIRSTGQSFDDAVLAMNDVASDFFGKNLVGLQRKFFDDDSRVEVGEIEVIGEEKEE